MPGPPPTYREQVPQVIEWGWTAATPEFQKWLETMTAEPWPTQLAAGTRMKPGVYINPRAEATGMTDAYDARQAAELLTVRALQLQDRGDPGTALNHLMTVLALSRHLRHHAPGYAYLAGLDAESAGLAGLNHWLNRVGRRPELLRRALGQLGEHEAATPPVTEALEAEYLRYRDRLGTGQRPGSHGNAEIEAMLMQTPWEAERARRLGDAVFAGRRRLAEAGEMVPLGGRRPVRRLAARFGAAPGASAWSAWSPRPGWPAGSPRRPPCSGPRSWDCAVSVRPGFSWPWPSTSAEHGQAATALDDLVTGLVLKELPDDPFTGRSFRYRVSQKDERITWHRVLPGGGESIRGPAPPGTGNPLERGPDGTDDGGTRQWVDPGKGAAGRDLIFLVPLPEGK